MNSGLFELEYPQSLGVYDDYAAAQKAVDFLSDEGFPVQNVLIVGTDLRQVERVTGRLTTGRVAGAGAASGAWLGLLIGMFVKYVPETSEIGVQVFGPIHGGIFVAYVLVTLVAARVRSLLDAR